MKRPRFLRLQESQLLQNSNKHFCNNLQKMHFYNVTLAKILQHLQFSAQNVTKKCENLTSLNFVPQKSLTAAQENNQNATNFEL